MGVRYLLLDTRAPSAVPDLVRHVEVNLKDDHAGRNGWSITFSRDNGQFLSSVKRLNYTLRLYFLEMHSWMNIVTSSRTDGS